MCNVDLFSTPVILEITKFEFCENNIVLVVVTSCLLKIHTKLWDLGKRTDFHFVCSHDIRNLDITWTSFIL